jgi:hypothetical protein
VCAARVAINAPVGLPRPSLLGFARITTNPRIFERPASLVDAWRRVAARLEPFPI